MDVRENDELRGKPAEDLVPIPLDPLDPEKVTYMGASLDKPLKGRMTTFLQENNDVFAWTAADMLGIGPNLITHRLNVDPTRKAIKQKKRTYAPDRLEAIKQENAGATYQRLVNKIFAHLIRKTMEVYVDDMLVKSLSKADHISHLREAFEVLRHHNMMLNQAKCAFGVGSGNFLGHMVKDFEWTTESQEAFEKLKKYMIEAPLLAKPSPEDILYLYLTVSEQAMSAVLVKEEQKLHKPIYYVSKVLHGAELNYSTTEKFALALITVSRKLRPYFQTHKIEALTDQPLRNILHSPKASGRLIKWAIELGDFDIKYKPRAAIKAQALADFVVECTINDQEVRGQEIVTLEEGEKEKDEETTVKEYWVLHFDGASKIKSSGTGLVLQSPDGFIIEYTLKLDFPTTNNEAEYEALIVGLGLARAVMAKNLKVCGDSRLVVAQVNGEFEAKDDTMAKYLRVVKGILT
ncbi:uncharacterized protein LOC141674577 [Apium graveolens]|uniref:uncharacterized protein LOC141674577 n=1 Tax=Apium graveolens TaxID=4045 RepID=UPI003D7BA7A4